MPQCEDLTEGQKKLYDKLENAIKNEQDVTPILEEIKKEGVLKEVLTTANITEKLEDGTKHTLTPLGYAMCFNNSEEKIKAILDVAEKNSILLDEVFAGIKEHDDRKGLQEILETLKNQEQDEEQKTKIDGWLEILAKSISSCESNENLLAPESSISETEKNIANNKGTKDKGNDAIKIESNTFKIENSDQKDTVKTTNKSIMIGSVCGAIALLAVGGGCFATGVALPILAIAGIAVSAALVIGVIAGGISHVVLRPSNDECLSKPQKSVVNSPKSQNKVQSQISDQEPKITIPQHLPEENLVSKADTNVKLTESSFKPNVVQQNTKPGSYFTFNDSKLLFFTTNENYKVLEEKCKNEDGNGKVIPGEFRIFVECESEKFCITGPNSSCQDVDDGKKSVFITSLRKQNAGKTVVTDPWQMIYKVGLNENKKFVEITRISRKPFVEVDAEAKILMEDLLSKVSAQDLDKVEKTPISKRSEEEEFYDAEDKQLSSITSDDDTLEFQDAIDDGITQPITSDMMVEQVETKTPSAVLNKSQGNNIVINGIFIPYGAKLKCFPELSNFLSKANLEREKLLWKVVPSSSLFRPREERLAINCQSIDAQ